MRLIWYPMILLAFSGQIYPESLKLGVENISQSFRKSLKNPQGSYALITNHTGQNQHGVSSLDVLQQHTFNISYLLAPEHGIRGTIAAEKEVPHTHDPVTKIPILSLYAGGTGKTLTPDIIASLDGFIFDIQDVGMRHYTYVSTLLRMLQTAATHHKIFIVLDRPNILGGRMEGPLVADAILERKSFIAAAPIPLRHGMTVGELARYFNNYVVEKPASLYVIPMTGYSRQELLPDTLIYHLSPNITSKQSCYGYSFLGLLGEVRPFDVGLGTPNPFTHIGLAQHHAIPVAHFELLKTQLKHLGIQAHVCTYLSTRNKKTHQGLSLKIDNVHTISSFNAFLHILAFFKNAGIELAFSTYFDHAVGTPLVREYLQGRISFAQLKAEINQSLQQFFTRAKTAFIYTPWPTVTYIE